MRGGWRPNKDCRILTPTLLAIKVFISRSPWLLNRRPGGPASAGHGSHSSIFSPTHLNFLSPGIYNNLTSTYLLRASQFRTQFNLSTVKVAPDLISLTGCTCYVHRCISSFDSLAGSVVNMQHFLKASIHFDSLSVMDGDDFLKLDPCMPLWPSVTKFFSVVLSQSMCIFAFGPSSSLSDSFTILLIHLDFLSCSLGCHIFPYMLLEFFRCFRMSCFVSIVLPCLDIFLIFPLLRLSFLAYLLELCCHFSCVAFFFFWSQHVQAFSFVSHFFFCCRFLICVSCRISHSGFEFILVFFRGTPTFSQTNLYV